MITLLGVNHKTCPVEIREKLSFSSDKSKEFLTVLKEDPLLKETALLSTCNRTEFYFYSEDEDRGKENILKHLKEKKSISSEEFICHLYFKKNTEAIEHLFSVASGIDSMIIGEGQILGQTKKALQDAREAKSIGPNICQLFNYAITSGKRARTETKIGTGASSVSFAAVEFAKMLFGNLSGRTAMIVGAGKMGRITATALAREGLKQIIVSNKTYEKAVETAKIFKGTAVKFDRLEEYLLKTDIVISSTGAPHCVIRYDTVKKAMRLRKNRPLFLIDIAVPRDIEQEINNLSNVYLYDIDDLQKVVENTLEERKEEISKVKKIIREEQKKFSSWSSSRDVFPVIKSLKEKAEEVRKEEIEKTLKKLSHLSDKELELIDYTTKKIINKLLHNPIVKLKEKGGNPAAAGLISEIFELKREEEEE